MLHVMFQVGGADYVVAASDVTQMESFTGVTAVPGAPAHVAGLVQLRGRVLPVVDVRARFGLPPAERPPEARIIVVGQQERRVALLVDRAREVIDLDADEFRAPPDVVAAQATGFVRSIAQRERRVLMLVDIEKVIGKDPLTREARHGEET
jgi:purine-binding chemotaxis protein CheW